MEGLGFPFFVLIAWVIFSVIRSAARAAGELEKKAPPPGGSLPKSLPGMNPDFLEMLRELERASRGQRAEPDSRRVPTPPRPVPQPTPRRAARPGPNDEPEFVEDVRSLEGAAREEVSLDNASEAAARRRREAAERRDRPRTPADHATFDARIRAESEKAVPAPPNLESIQRLRSALVWNELLSPPVSLRDERGTTSR